MVNAKQYGIYVKLSAKCSNLTKFNVSSKKIEEKFKIRNFPLLGKGKDSLVNKEYEEVLFLLLNKRFPNTKEKKIFNEKIKSAYKIDFSYQFELLEKNIEIFRDKPFALIEMLLLSLATVNSKEICRVSLFIQFFIITVNFFNKFVGRNITLPNSNLSIIENWLMMIGKDYNDNILTQNFSKMMIAWMECGLASSSIAARVNISSRADFIPSVISGFINCSGKKHTSARIECAKFLLNLEKQLKESLISIKSEKDKVRILIKKIIQDKLNKKLLVYGFGHYIFKGLTEDGIDPRISIVKHSIKTMYPESKYLSMSEIAVDLFKSGELIKNNKCFKLPPNSDIYWTSFLLDFFKDYGNPPVKLISLFNILTRVSGLIAHCDEQYLETNPIRVQEFCNN